LSLCPSGQENLCDHPLFTGYTRDGGFATSTISDARFAFPLGEVGSDVELAPLLCAGLIGWRSLVIAGDGKKLGLYGFGAAAHIVAQVAKWQGRSVFAFTRPMSPPKPSPSDWARPGLAGLTKHHPSHSTPPSSLRLWALWCYFTTGW
jgi:D-arabinose 1-dehydrogenase-like Zn-dependent alcohol dehydrogenase